MKPKRPTPIYEDGLLRIQWEFMRRSGDYRKSYRTAARLRAGGKHLEEIKIAEQFGILGLMPDPALGWEQLDPNDRSGLSCWPKNAPGLRFIFDFEKPSRFKIEIDLAEVRNVTALKDSILMGIGLQVRVHDFQKKVSRRDRGKTDDWDTVIKAGDLKASGLRNVEIAKRLFPKSFRHGPAVRKETKEAHRRNAESKVAQLLKKFDAMTNGGFARLTSP